MTATGGPQRRDSDPDGGRDHGAHPTDGLSTLNFSYRGPGVMKGDTFLLGPGGTNTHTFHGPYEIVDGTGIFEGVTGRGRLSGSVSATYDGTVFGALSGEWTMEGTLHLPG